MDAIVLTYDQQAGLAELLYKTYEELWPEHPFRFKVPFNGPDSPLLGHLGNRQNVDLVLCATDIRSTLQALLSAYQDDEWVFWAIDDRFPVQLDSAGIEAILDSIEGYLPHSIRAIRLFRWRESCSTKTLRIGRTRFAFQDDQTLFGYYHHQFARVGLLRQYMLSPSLLGNYTLADVNQMFNGRFDPSGVLVPLQDLALFDEPLVAGKLTTNGLKALRRHGCSIPPYETTEYSVEFRRPTLSKVVQKGRVRWIRRFVGLLLRGLAIRG